MAFIWLKPILRPRLKNYTHPKVSTYVSMTDPPFNEADKILEVSVKSVWIKHGGLAGFGSMFTFPVVGQLIKHHWVQITTDNGLYSVQFHGGLNSLFIHKKHSEDDIFKEAKQAAGVNDEDHKNVRFVHPAKSIIGDKTIKDLNEFVESYSKLGKYDLTLNNCQDFAFATYKWCD